MLIRELMLDTELKRYSCCHRRALLKAKRALRKSPTDTCCFARHAHP